MEESTRTPQPEVSAEQVLLFRLTPGDLTGQRRTRRQAVLAALITARNLPRRRLLRAGWMALGLVCLGIALAAGWRCAFRGLTPAGWLYGLPCLGLVLIAIGIGSPLLARQLDEAVRGFAGAGLYPDHLHLEGADDPADWPLADLGLVRRFRGWTVLVWQRETRLLVLPVPDAVCPAGGDGLAADLRKAAPQATFHVRLRPPRGWPGQLALLPLLPVLLFTMLLLSFSSQGRQILSSFHPDSGSLVLLVYDRTTRTLWTPDADPFPYSATGEVSFRWQTDDCCAVTYRTTDDTLQVELLPGSLHTAQRLNPDPPTGSWRQFFLTTELDVALQWDEATQSYLLRDEGAETVYRQWEDFDGLGIALCDDRGVPQWTLTPTRAPRWNADGTSLDTTALILCPVSLQETGERTQLLPDDGTMPDAGSTPDADSDTAAQPTPAPTPTFDDTIDVCLNEGGLFFTWDGGATCSQPLTGPECSVYGLEEEADLEPLVLRQDVAAFLVTPFSGHATVYVTTDQGQSWQTSDLVQWPWEFAITHRCLGFTEDGFGYVSVSSDVTEGGDINITLFTTRDGGVSWQACAWPKPDIDATRPITGLIFTDENTALASMASGDDNPWPHIFSTLDGGATWRELPVNFAASGLTVATRLTDFTRQGDEWRMTVTQEPYGREDLVFRANAPDGPWAYVKP